MDSEEQDRIVRATLGLASKSTIFWASVLAYGGIALLLVFAGYTWLALLLALTGFGVIVWRNR